MRPPLSPLAAEVLSAIRSPDCEEWLAELVARASEAGARRALAEQGEPLEPLASILGCSLDAARMRLRRDPELAALGALAGRRLLFRRSEVLAFLAARRRGGRASLRLVGGE